MTRALAVLCQVVGAQRKSHSMSGFVQFIGEVCANGSEAITTDANVSPSAILNMLGQPRETGNDAKPPRLRMPSWG